VGDSVDNKALKCASKPVITPVYVNQATFESINKTDQMSN